LGLGLGLGFRLGLGSPLLPSSTIRASTAALCLLRFLGVPAPALEVPLGGARTTVERRSRSFRSKPLGSGPASTTACADGVCFVRLSRRLG